MNVQVLTSSGGIEDFINRRARRSKTGTVTWDCFGDVVDDDDGDDLGGGDDDVVNDDDDDID